MNDPQTEISGHVEVERSLLQLNILDPRRITGRKESEPPTRVPYHSVAELKKMLDHCETEYPLSFCRVVPSDDRDGFENKYRWSISTPYEGDELAEDHWSWLWHGLRGMNVLLANGADVKCLGFYDSGMTSGLLFEVSMPHLSPWEVQALSDTYFLDLELCEMEEEDTADVLPTAFGSSDAPSPAMSNDKIKFAVEISRPEFSELLTQLDAAHNSVIRDLVFYHFDDEEEEKKVRGHLVEICDVIRRIHRYLAAAEKNARDGNDGGTSGDPLIAEEEQLSAQAEAVSTNSKIRTLGQVDPLPRPVSDRDQSVAAVPVLESLRKRELTESQRSGYLRGYAEALLDSLNAGKRNLPDNLPFLLGYTDGTRALLTDGRGCDWIDDVILEAEGSTPERLSRLTMKRYCQQHPDGVEAGIQELTWSLSIGDNPRTRGIFDDYVDACMALWRHLALFGYEESEAQGSSITSYEDE